MSAASKRGSFLPHRPLAALGPLGLRLHHPNLCGFCLCGPSFVSPWGAPSVSRPRAGAQSPSRGPGACQEPGAGSHTGLRPLTGRAGWASAPRGSGRASAPLRPSAAPSWAAAAVGRGPGVSRGQPRAGSLAAGCLSEASARPRAPPASGSSPGIWDRPQDLPAALLGVFIDVGSVPSGSCS